MGSRKIRLAGGQFQRRRAFCGGGSAFPWATGDVTRGNGWAGWQARDSGQPNHGGQSQRRRAAKVRSRQEVEEELEDLVAKTKKFRGLSIK